MATGLLSDVRVLDRSRDGGASVCARILEQLGAAVRQEDPADVARRPIADDNLVISDARPFESQGIAPSLAQLRPGQVGVSVTPFGLAGPYATRDDSEEATLGFDGAVADALAGAHAAVVGLAALRAARRYRRALAVEVSTFEVMATCLGDLVPAAACPDQPALRGLSGRVDQRIAVLPCADGYVGLVAPTAGDLTHLAALAGLNGATPGNAPLETFMGPWLRAHTRSEVCAAAQLWRISIVPVLDEREARVDQQSIARESWGHAAASGPRPRSPFRFNVGPPHLPGAGHRAERARSPLGGVRVLDLGMVWAGPYCGRLLTGLGAEVIKIEGPTRRDGTRPPDGWRGCLGTFGDLNRGKASLVLNLSSAAGRDMFLALAAASDVVLENFSPRVLPNFGLGYAALAAANPALVMLALPAFGSDGPWAHYVAYGSGLELATGLSLSLPDGRPTAAPVPYLDYLSGAYGAVAIIAALVARDRSGQGASVEVAQREVACQVLGALSGQKLVRAVPAPDAAALLRDPHLNARELFTQAGYCPAGSHYARLPWQLRGLSRRRAEPRAPDFGADSRRILRDVAGLAPAQVERFVANGVVVAARAQPKRASG